MWRNALLLGLLWLSICVPALQASPLIKAEVDKHSLLENDTLKLKVVIFQETSTKQGFIQSPTEQPIVSLQDFEILDHSSGESFSTTQDTIRMVLTYSYEIRPRYSGKLSIPAIPYRYQENNQAFTVKTQPIVIIAKPLGIQFRFPIWALLTFGTIVLILVALVLWAFRRPKVKDRPLEKNPQKEVLSQKQSVPLPQNIHMRVAQLHQRIKTEISHRLLIDSETQTTQEIIQALKYQPAYHENDQKIISEALLECDRHRFQPISMTEAEFDLLSQKIDQIIPKPTGTKSL